MKLFKLLIVSLILSACAWGGVARAQDLSSFFKGTDGCFVLYDMKRDRYTRHNEARCRTRFSPKSTFKIPNSLIGLETGVIGGADFVIPWDKAQYPDEGWNAEPFVHWKRDHDLRSAFKYSVLWYYREIAKRVGAERMKELVTKLDYGNRDTSGVLDRFWLNETLKISADEQIEFLKKLYAGKLPVSRRSIDIVKDIMVQESTPVYKLSAKTGGGPRAEGVVIGWYVGYVETRGDVYFFAMNIDGPNYLSIRDKRIEMTRRVLADLGVLPKQ
ncbi:MAG TPA: penicillin-binding transpeptidase domain-containing protein [Pyrinomonadaceae bacterium]|nr:penicillin-binding transpeptidase domain-containing protein [Pyrinomonadaceae bacterium]